MYAMDTFKAQPKMDPDSWIAGNLEHKSGQSARPVRAAHRFVPGYGHDVSQPLDQTIQTSVRSLFPGTPLISWQPRASAAYKVSDKMAVHAGGGVFNDIIPAQIADFGATNAPYAPVFVGGINGQVGGVAIAPGVPGSAVDATAQANRSFQSVFRSGGAGCAGLPADAPTCPLAVSLNTFPSGTLKTPYFLAMESRHRARTGSARRAAPGLRGHARRA